MPRDLRSLQYPRDFHPFALFGLEGRINEIQDQELKEQLLGELFSLGQTIEHLDGVLTEKVKGSLVELNSYAGHCHNRLKAMFATEEILIEKAEYCLGKSLEEENLENKNLLVTDAISNLQNAKSERDVIGHYVTERLFSDLENIFRSHLR